MSRILSSKIEDLLLFTIAFRVLTIIHYVFCSSEDVSKRENVRVRPRSAKRRKSKDQETERDRGSTVTLSDGTYERVDIDGSDSGEDAYYEDRACQTGWELLERYDQVSCSNLSTMPSSFFIRFYSILL